jgi:hypothetical protein
MLITPEKDLLKLIKCGQLREFDIEKLKEDGKNGAKNLIRRLNTIRQSPKGQEIHNNSYQAR